MDERGETRLNFSVIFLFHMSRLHLHAGRGKSEVQYLHGEVVRAGEKCSVPTPVNKALTETLTALTNKEIPLEEFAHRPEKLLEKIPVR